MLKPDGNYLYGFNYQSKTTTGRGLFDAKQYAGGFQKVKKNQVLVNLSFLIEKLWAQYQPGSINVLTRRHFAHSEQSKTCKFGLRILKANNHLPVKLSEMKV